MSILIDFFTSGEIWREKVDRTAPSFTFISVGVEA